jgi:hypothetical protein
MSYLNGTGKDDAESEGLRLFKTIVRPEMFSGREAKHLRPFIHPKLKMSDSTNHLAKQIDTELRDRSWVE